MKKRILSIVLSICMVLSFVPVMPITASAEGTCNCPAKCTDSYKDPDCPVCNSGGNCESRRNRRIYDDGMGITTQFHLQAALDWKDAAHYLYYFPLDADITVSSNITVPGNADFVLDLNGHTLSGGDKWAIFKVYGKLTIIDTKGGGKLVDAQGAIKIAGGYVLMKGGAIENCTISGGALVQSGGTFKMTGGTLKNNTAYVGFWSNAEEYPASIYCDSGGGTVVIDGDAQVLCCDQDNCSHFGAVCKVTTLYADGGKIKGGIYNEFISDSGTVTGTITSHHTGIGEGTLIDGKILNYGTVSGGTYLGEVENIGGGIISGGSFAGKVTNTASISGGTFNSEVDNQGTVSGGSFAGKVTNTASISGGTFNSEVVNQDTISGGMYSETGVVKNSGTVSGGTFLGTVETENGTIEDRAKVSVNFVNEDGETMKTVRVLRGQRITSADLPEFDPTQYGYKKLKYSVGNTDYRDEDKFINEVRFTEDETRVTVTRISPIAYTITCILNNGQQDRTYTYTVTDPDFTLHNPTKDGYVFTGWGGTGLEGTSNMTVTIPKGSIGDREYTAYYWKNIGGDLISPDYSYTVVYDTKGGRPVEPKTVPKLLASAEKVLDGADTTRAGYRFTGWYCGNKRIALQDTTVKDLADRADNGVITITAHWREKLEVSFNTAAQECTYDGTEKAFDIKDTTLDGFQVTYRKNGNTVTAPINAGSYDIIVTREEDQNYKAANVTIPGGLVIKPKEVIVTISEISDRIYTGNYIKPAIKVSDGTNEIPASEYTVDYANNINAGTATVTVTAKAGGNYAFSQITKNFTIKKKTISPAVTMADYVYGTYPDSPVISGNEGGGAVSVYYSTYDDIADNTAHRLLWNVDAIDGAMLKAGTYYMMAEVEETQNYTAGISPVSTFRVLTNQYAAPTGEITIGTNSWKAFLNKITFGLFFKDTKTVTITASDNSGDAVTVSYLLSDKALTADDLAVKEFTAYTGRFDIEPNNEWIIYVMLTDEAGNVTYLSSDGIVLDNVAPVISGVENGKIYCGAQTVTVNEKYIDSVTVNGKEITLNNNQFTLPAEGKQKIVATDKAGNVSAEITVTVNDGHTDENKNHKCDICGENVGVHEDKNKDHKCDICGEEVTTCKDNNKDHLCDVCGATLSEHTGGIVTCTEKAVCEYCHKPYGEPKGHNYKETVVIPTDFTLGGTQHKCDNCGDEYWVDFTTKDNYSQTVMPNGDTITRYINHHGSEAETNVDIENPIVSVFMKDPSGTLKRMEDDGIKIYTITTGAEQTVPSKAEKIVFRSDAPFDEFDQVMINGLVLDKKYYSVKKGSTIVTLNEDFVKEIPTGMHLFGIISKDGVAITTFTVDDKAAVDNDTNSPQTGDNSHMALWIALFFVSSGAVFGTTVVSKKKKHSKH